MMQILILNCAVLFHSVVSLNVIHPLIHTKVSHSRMYDSMSSAEMLSTTTFLTNTALKKEANGNEVIQNLLNLEKGMREQNRNDNGKTADKTLKYLNGSWRLIFTTGTIDTQKKVGSINYFPLKAIQSFNTNSNEITNAIFIGDFPVIKFFGEFEFIKQFRKVEFDFDSIALFGFKINLPRGGAAKIGQSTGIYLYKKNYYINWL